MRNNRHRIFRHMILSVAGVVVVVAGAAQAVAQEQPPKPPEKSILRERHAAPFGGGQFIAAGAHFAFETKVVKGAPYSAEAVTETVQTLTDGNRIRSKTAAVVARDNEGRTRREMGGQERGPAKVIFINDPVAGANYVLEPDTRTARKLEFAQFHGNGAVVQFHTEVEKVLGSVKQQDDVLIAHHNLIRRASDATPPVRESLGKQVIEGVEAEGTRTTITIPAGEIGNELPINIVSEQWYSPELQVLVLTKHSDPRMGETVYRLTRINRGEPDRALFEVPADYTVTAERGPVIQFEKKIKVKGEKPEDDR